MHSGRLAPGGRHGRADLAPRLVPHRRGRLLATAVGVAVGVALLASIGTFLSATTAQMTKRAIGRVAVDWQVELSPRRSTGAVLSQVALVRRRRDSRCRSSSRAPGLRAPPRRLDADHRSRAGARAARRLRAGVPGRVACARRSRRRRAARPADRGEPPRAAAATRVKIGGRAPVVRVDGIVDLPAADSLFQRVGAPVGAQPQAPPDNVILLPPARLRAMRAPGRRTQIHVAAARTRCRAARAPPSPRSRATRATSRRGSPAPARSATTSARRSTARSDALYAQLLFLFLGVPGAILAGLITASIAAAGAGRRRRDAALLRTRGASTRQLVRVALAEAALAGGAGVAARPRPARCSSGSSRSGRRASAPVRSPPSRGPAARRSPGSPSPRPRSRCRRGATRAR